jgi:nucleotide-binding universal stress UspA family protein
VQPDIPESWAGGGGADEYRQLLRQRAQSDLAALAAPLRQLSLEVTLRYQWHAAMEQGIGRHLAHTQPDLVVKEPFGHGKTDPATGRIDCDLIAHVPALLMVRPGVWPGMPRLAVALDPPPPPDPPRAADEWLLRKGHALATLLRGSLEVLHVLQGPAEMTWTTRTAIGLQARGVGATARYAEGPVAEGLLQLAATHPPDVLLMGAATRPHSFPAADGGTAARVFAGIGCDMLVLAPPATARPQLAANH